MGIYDDIFMFNFNNLLILPISLNLTTDIHVNNSIKLNLT